MSSTNKVIKLRLSIVTTVNINSMLDALSLRSKGEQQSAHNVISYFQGKKKKQEPQDSSNTRILGILVVLFVKKKQISFIMVVQLDISIVTAVNIISMMNAFSFGSRIIAHVQFAHKQFQG